MSITVTVDSIPMGVYIYIPIHISNTMYWVMDMCSVQNIFYLFNIIIVLLIKYIPSGFYMISLKLLEYYCVLSLTNQTNCVAKFQILDRSN